MNLFFCRLENIQKQVSRLLGVCGKKKKEKKTTKNPKASVFNVCLFSGAVGVIKKTLKQLPRDSRVAEAFGFPGLEGSHQLLLL